MNAAGRQAVHVAWVGRRSLDPRHGRGGRDGLPWRFLSMSTGGCRKRWIEGASRSLHNHTDGRVVDQVQDAQMGDSDIARQINCRRWRINM